MDRYITHQVSSVHTSAIIKAAKLESACADDVPEVRQRRTRLDPDHAGRRAGDPQKGDRVLLMGVGSGLNTAMMELAW